MKDKIALLVAFVKHIVQVLSFLAPSKLTAFMEEVDGAGFNRGKAVGFVEGRQETLTEFARMPRPLRRKLVSGAVKTFGRKPKGVGVDWNAYQKRGA